ncbi:hypothetical protein PIB30_047905 [Stylosanthes scabra]|uniref:Uncharacterized protein n=1 Tax=Stylosanthes scabra TaxID=79078 RepID=A0ABU6SH43_9FABA|nr:hypothetical protein [Stylosanthes scabra]
MEDFDPLQLLKSNIDGESASKTTASDGGTNPPLKTTAEEVAGDAVNLALTMDVGKVPNPKQLSTAQEVAPAARVNDGNTKPAYSANELLIMYMELSKETHELSAHLLPSPTRELIHESILYQFSTIHRRLLVAITFDPELRLMHCLRLCGAYHLLYASNLGLRARSSLVNPLKIMRLMVVLGCSKSGGAAFGVPLSVGIQKCSRAPENRFYLKQSRFSEPFPKKKGTSRAKNRFPLIENRFRFSQRPIDHLNKDESDLKRLQQSDSDVLRVDSALEMVWKRARESIRGEPESIH